MTRTKQPYTVIHQSEFETLSKIRSNTTFRVFAELKMKIRGRPVADYLNNQDLKKIGMDRHTYGRAIKELLSLGLIKISEMKTIRGRPCRLFSMVHDAYTTGGATHTCEDDLSHETPPLVAPRTHREPPLVTLDTTTGGATHIPLTTRTIREETIRTTEKPVMDDPINNAHDKIDDVFSEMIARENPMNDVIEKRYRFIKQAIKTGLIQESLFTYDDLKNILTLEEHFHEFSAIVRGNLDNVRSGEAGRYKSTPSDLHVDCLYAELECDMSGDGSVALHSVPGAAMSSHTAP